MNDKQMRTWDHFHQSAQSGARHRWVASCEPREWFEQIIWSARPLQHKDDMTTIGKQAQNRRMREGHSSCKHIAGDQTT